MSGIYARIYKIIGQIPKGRVATYGQIATLAGIPRQARRVGYALSALPDGVEIPWHRVVNAQGGISPRGEPHFAEEQRALLEREKVRFDSRGRIPLARFLWKPE